MKKEKSIKEVKGLTIGDKVLNLKAKDIYDASYSLTDALKKGSVVVIFIRGQWCPFCNKHLRNIQNNLELIYKKGASVVVISPEKSEFIKQTIKKTGAEFTILYDENSNISDAFDLTFKPTLLERTMYNVLLGAKLKESHTDTNETLPVPATFIIDTEGKVKWKHFDTDYKKRSLIKDILENL